MKFTFEADMQKGQCYKCPMSQEREIGSICAIDDCFVLAIEDPSDCPLKESNEVEWHPYPREEPTDEYGYYLVTIADREVHEAIWSDGFYWDDGDLGECRIEDITAWAKMPMPYKEEENEGK